MQILVSLSISMLAGLLMSRVAKLLKLPAVTAYLVAGILVGPFLLGAIEFDFFGNGLNYLGFSPADFGIVGGEKNSALEVISDVALGFIAFAIGNEFRLNELKAIGKQATVIGILQAVVTTIVVDAALIALSFAMPGVIKPSMAVILGAIATATAPAATLMVVRQYKAKGKLTDLLLPIVALDDAVGLVVFSVSFGIAKGMDSGEISAISMLVNPLLEVVLSLALGFVMGVLFTYCEKLFHSGSRRMSISITFVLLTVALSKFHFELGGGVEIGFSSLLVCMMLGTVFCNLCDFSADIMDRADKWTAPLFVLFFVLSGAELRLDILADVAVVIVGVVYIISRSIGKYFGAYGSAKISGCDENIQKYLGITLLPQAGVALGMSAIVLSEMGSDGILIRNIVLFAVLVYEIFGPVLTKIALTKAGDIKEKTTEGFDRKKFLEEKKHRDAARHHHHHHHHHHNHQK